MGSGTLTDRSTGQTILQEFFNDIHGALDGDFVGRNSSGVATSGQNLGTAAVPWGTIRGSTLVLGGVAIDTSQITSVVNRIISGKKRSTSNQPAFITPNGAAASFVLAGATTNLVLDINGSSVTVTTDITKSSLSTAPSSQNTCLVNDADAAGQHDTRLWGEREHTKAITVDTMGTNISSIVGSYAAFKVNSEYFWAYVESTTKLSKCYRGYFYNSSLAPLNRGVLTDNDTITLMKTGWVFVQNDATTVDVSYTNPVYDFTSPTSPATGDYWYDLGNTEWKRYDGATWQVINRTLVGMVVMDSTNCVAARCLPFYGNYKDTNTIPLEISTTEIVAASQPFGKVNVNGTDIHFGDSLTKWNITSVLATSADLYDSTEQASRMYYMYVKDTGATVISDISPYTDHLRLGKYHPHNPWRCVGMAYNNGSSNLVNASGFYDNDSEVSIQKQNTYAATNTYAIRYSTEVRNVGASVTYVDDTNLGAYFLINEEGWYYVEASAFDSTAAQSLVFSIVKNYTSGLGGAEIARASGLLSIATAPGTNAPASVSGLKKFKIGDKIFAIGDGGTLDTAQSFPGFSITKLERRF